MLELGDEPPLTRLLMATMPGLMFFSAHWLSMNTGYLCVDPSSPPAAEQKPFCVQSQHPIALRLAPPMSLATLSCNSLLFPFYFTSYDPLFSLLRYFGWLDVSELDLSCVCLFLLHAAMGSGGLGLGVGGWGLGVGVGLSPSPSPSPSPPAHATFRQRRRRIIVTSPPPTSHTHPQHSRAYCCLSLAMTPLPPLLLTLLPHVFRPVPPRLRSQRCPQRLHVRHTPPCARTHPHPPSRRTPHPHL